MLRKTLLTLSASVSLGAAVAAPNAALAQFGPPPGPPPALAGPPPGLGAGSPPPGLALQLPFRKASESMGNHDSEIVDAGSVD